MVYQLLLLLEHIQMNLQTKQLHVIEGLRKNNAASEMEVLEIQSRIQRLNSQIAEATTANPRLRAAQSGENGRGGAKGSQRFTGRGRTRGI